jgi:hypothetical protein
MAGSNRSRTFTSLSISLNVNPMEKKQTEEKHLIFIKGNIKEHTFITTN